jgi:4-hydroxythreonine-4-phosphate dehydrogenase
VGNGLSCLILADDFTGACDTGLQFVQKGLCTRVALDLSGTPPDSTDVLVWDSETRNLSQAAARQRLGEAREQLKAVAVRVCYKKIDSTLRGPLAAEITALMDSRGDALCLIAPAFPQAGRITVGGYQLLHGVPVERTEMGADPGAPVRQSFIPRLFEGADLDIHLLGWETIAKGTEHILAEISSLKGSAKTAVVLDATAPEDLLQIARAAARMEPVPLLCGSAGLAAQIPEAFELKPTDREDLQVKGRDGPVLIVVGSGQELTQRQLKVATTRFGLRPWRMPADQHCLAEIKSRFRNGEDTLLLGGDGTETEDRGRIVASLAQAGADLCGQVSPAGIVVTGGWTAVSLLQALGGEGVEILEQVDEGVPLCRLEGGPYQGLPVVTKAGALGSEQAFLHALDRLKRSEGGSRPLLGITMGDPCGIGPEVIAKALADPEVSRICRPLVIGHPVFLEEGLGFGSADISIHPVESPEEGDYQLGQIEVLNPVDIELNKIERGKVCPEAGRAAVEWVVKAVDLALAGRIDGIVTAPLNKEAMNRAGYTFAGHTELLGARTQSKNYRMLLSSERLKVIHVTVHVALNQVPQRLTPERVFDTIALGHQALVDLGQKRPRVAVAGLNPHAGESGLFGHEDAEAIQPAVQRAIEEGWDVQGPLPADTLFFRAQQGEFDLVVAMYHDQGHIPVKLVAFADTVNVTLGLPIVRTSVDHGTAFDIVGKGVADHGNMIEAIRMGAKLAQGRAKKAKKGALG